MAYNMESLTCPGCGFPVKIGDSYCPAGHPLNISTFNSVADMPMPLVNKYVSAYRKELDADPDVQKINYSIGICYLKLKLYDKALQAFEKAIEDNFDNSETFFYAAICLLQGKKPFVHQRSIINKVIEYLNAAIAIESKGIYYYFLAFVYYDYFERKFLIHTPHYDEILSYAYDLGVSDFDVSQLFSILQLIKPEGFNK